MENNCSLEQVAEYYNEDDSRIENFINESREWYDMLDGIKKNEFKRMLHKKSRLEKLLRSEEGKRNQKEKMRKKIANR